MNIYLLVILVALVGRYILDLVCEQLNLRHIKEELPAEFEGYYDAERYETSQRYLRDNTRFGLLKDTVQTLITLVFLLVGGFQAVDTLARLLNWPEIATGLVFAGILGSASLAIGIPFSYYDTFVIEERYGFNKTTLKTFVTDIVKEALLGAAIGAPVFALIQWFFLATGDYAWLYCWYAVVAIQVFILFIAPYVIMPLFNKFEPLEAGELRAAIEDYARQQNFRIKGVFKMDGSKRSAKTNAFFTGFGSSRRIVLYDTLIEKHTVPELLAIVAHEMGHHKKGHIPRAIARSVVISGVTFFLLSLFINNRQLFDAFRMKELSIYASLVFFGFLYAPVGMVLGIVENVISRRHEFEADAYAAATTEAGAPPMIAGLKKLSVENLSNLTPHPMKVFLGYSHPPVLERIRALRRQGEPEGN